MAPLRASFNDSLNVMLAMADSEDLAGYRVGPLGRDGSCEYPRLESNYPAAMSVENLLGMTREH